MNKETKTGYIYSLTCNNPNLIYYGSTTKSLNERLSQHKCDFKINKCVSSKILFEWGDVKINMIEEIEFQDKKELLDRESYYIRNLECVNKKIPNRTQKEWYIDNKKRMVLQNKEYYEKNKEKIKEYYYDNKDKLKENRKEYRLKNKNHTQIYNKKYQEKNKEKLKQKKKEYNEKNKDKRKKYNDENKIKRKNKIICPCGGKYSESRFTEHKKTQKHKVYEFLKEIENSNIKL
ncbi:GIY-YIG catalytic domain [seawater metagenome]|uniref:GIY-YIG catalytic domain n=1 Tax=seawater metagenome TaxID=1561972 RepID=A0A5E8CJY7_9ZZZZ